MKGWLGEWLALTMQAPQHGICFIYTAVVHVCRRWKCANGACSWYSSSVPACTCGGVQRVNAAISAAHNN
jgi:hypothetical protein